MKRLTILLFSLFAGALSLQAAYDGMQAVMVAEGGSSVIASAEHSLSAASTTASSIDEQTLLDGRIYDPQLGRFLSADPIIQDPYNLQSYNRYSYCMNNPLSHIDPSGYISKDQQAKLRGAVQVLRRDVRNSPTSGSALVNRLLNCDIESRLLDAPIPLNSGDTAAGTARPMTQPAQIAFTINSSDSEVQLARRIAEEAIHSGQVPAFSPETRIANEIEAKVGVEEIMIAAGEPGVTYDGSAMVSYTMNVLDADGNQILDRQGNPIQETRTMQESTQIPVSVTINSEGIITSVAYVPNQQYITSRVEKEYNTQAPQGNGNSDSTETIPVQEDKTQPSPNEEELFPDEYK
ncbi:MAG: RHS repeat-associated core domain-containing protein [Opitutales bacterium]|nr:RHS repeat-associated core domain-containing protein [Opitutales bacterium]